MTKLTVKSLPAILVNIDAATTIDNEATNTTVAD
jgi:hypothetical protein